MYEDALAKEPKNPQYRESLNKAKAALSEKLTKKAKSILGQKPLTYDLARAAYQEAEKALTLTPAHWDARNLVTQAKSELERINKKAETLYAEALSYYFKEAERFGKNEDWDRAMASLLMAQEIFPDKKEIDVALREARARHDPDYYLAKAETHAARNEWEMAEKMALKAQNISP